MNIRNKTARLAPVAAIAATALLAACSDTTGTIGSSLVEDETEVVVETGFKVTGHSSATNLPVHSYWALSRPTATEASRPNSSHSSSRQQS